MKYVIKSILPNPDGVIMWIYSGGVGFSVGVRQINKHKLEILLPNNIYIHEPGMFRQLIVNRYMDWRKQNNAKEGTTN
jgi:hypothetical protein